MIAGTLTGDDPLKGWIAGIVGLFIATIGQESQYAYERFAFGVRDLAGGISLVPALVGAFGFAELLTAMKERRLPVKINPFDSVIPKLRDVTQYWRTIIRSGLIGTGVGIVPGVGEDVAAWSSYAAAKRASKEKEKFGKGSVEGLMAAETGDNACVPGAMIPVLTLAVPGSAPAAVLLAAMIIHGIRPGPMIMVENPQFVYDVVAMMLFATLGILIYGLTLTRLLVQVLRVPQHLIVPIIFVLCVVGSFALAGPAVRCLRDAGFRADRLLAAPARVTRWRRWCWASCSATCWRRTCAARWCCPTAAWCRSSRGRSPARWRRW